MGFICAYPRSHAQETAISCAWPARALIFCLQMTIYHFLSRHGGGQFGVTLG